MSSSLGAILGMGRNSFFLLHVQVGSYAFHPTGTEGLFPRFKAAKECNAWSHTSTLARLYGMVST
jgi:hypothetical protein